MSKEAFVFPGQGSQHKGMGLSLLEQPDSELAQIAKHTFDEANDVLGDNYRTICLENPDGKLDRTLYTQPSLLIVSTAADRMLKHIGRTPAIVAGHSAGEYAALVAAGSLNYAEALALVSERGRAMEEAMEIDKEKALQEMKQEDPGRMAAILGASNDFVHDIFNGLDPKLPVEIANINAEGQIIIAGRNSAIEYVTGLISQGKVKVLKNISIASHCSLMEPAKRMMTKAIDIVDFKTPHIPFISNVTGKFVTTSEGVRSGLVEQMTGTVQWLDTMKLIAEEGVDSVVEVGPGVVLTNLFKRTTGIEAVKPEMIFSQTHDVRD